VSDDITGATPAQQKTIDTLRAALSMNLQPAKRRQVGEALNKLINNIGAVPEAVGAGSTMSMASGGTAYDNNGFQQEATANLDGTVSLDHELGMATGADIQEARFKSMDYSVQASMLANLNGQIDNGISGMAAREEMQEVTGESPSQFARRFSIPEGAAAGEVYQVSPTTGAYTRHMSGSALPGAGTESARTALSMQKKAGEYMDIGPGGRLLSQNVTGESEEAYREKLQDAYSRVGEYADMYFTKAAKAGPLYAQRREQLTGELVSHLLDGQSSWKSDMALPLPSELSTEGLTVNQAVGFRMGGAGGTSPYNYMTHDAATEALKARGSSVTGQQQQDLVSAGPSLQKTLQKQALAGFQDWDMFLDDVKEVRETLRADGLSTRDEYRGNKTRILGLDNVDGEQADFYQNVNDVMLSTSGIEDYAGTSVSDRDSMYGRAESNLTDMIGSIAPTAPVAIKVEDMPEATELDRYRKRIAGSHSPEQGSAEWKAQRVGKVTGSKAPELWKGRGAERMAATLASERLGISPDISNAYTTRGNKMEAKVLNSFMGKEGKNFTYEEAFFETNKDLPGFGASPDGRLYNPDGSSAGLLELKYFGDSTFDAAYAKTMPQMQTQMMVTGESQTHFFATNADTGESQYQIAYADKAMQDELRTLGEAALNLEGSLDIRGVDRLRAKTKGARRQKGQQLDQTPATAFVGPNLEADEPMTAYDPTSEDGNSRSAKGMASSERQAYSEQGKRDQEVISAIQKMGKVEDQAYAMDMDKDARKSSDHNKALAENSRRASDSLKEFSSAAKGAVGVLGELASVALAGNKSGMDEKRLAAESGMDVENVRGMRNALLKGGLDMDGATSTINTAGSIVSILNDERTAATWYTRLMEGMGATSLPEINKQMKNIPTAAEISKLDPQELAALFVGVNESLSTEDKAHMGRLSGFKYLAKNTTSSGEIREAWDDSINSEGLEDTYLGKVKIDKFFRESKEWAGSLGEGWGTAAALTSAAVPILGSLGGGALLYQGGKLLQKSKTVSSLGSSLKDAAKAIPKNGLNVAKGLSVAARVNPIAIAASVAPTVARSVGGIEDDGGLGDSAMDVLDFASYGAGIGGTLGLFGGPLAPLSVPMGALLGGVAGAGIGIANEAWEYFSADDAIPSASIGGLNSANSQGNSVGKTVNNVDVNVEISPDLVKTSTNVNGDLDVDEETLTR